MAPVPVYVKERIVALHQQSYRPCDILRALSAEDIDVKDTTIRKIIKAWKSTGSVERKKGSGTKSRVSFKSYYFPFYML